MKNRLMKILLISFVLSCVLMGCGKKNYPKNAQIASSFDILSVIDRWDRADMLAEKWDVDSYLDVVTVDIPLPNGNRGAGANISFEFLTRNDDYITFVISCNEHNCKDYFVKQEDGFPVIHGKPLMRKDVSFDTKGAFKIGVDACGRKYLYRHNSTLIMSLYYDENVDGGKNIWKFSATDYTIDEDFDLLIDANTGEVLEVID